MAAPTQGQEERMPEFKVGSSGSDVTQWQEWFNRYASSYAPPVDGYYGAPDEAAVKIMQSRLGLPVTGRFDDATASRVGYNKGPWAGGVVVERRKIWIYTAPGSGADWWVGPSFEVGEFAKNVLKINHQPLYFQKGGYLGLLGGDPAFSYQDVIWDQGLSLEYCLDHNPDINDPDLELWFSGYSQSADGMEDAVQRLFGDETGKYRDIRERINGLIQFGNPSRQKNSGPAPGWGIARKTRPVWLRELVTDIVATSPGAPDFYAACDDEIRPLFYEWFVEAETELPFVIYTAQIIIPALLNLVAPFLSGLGGITNPLAAGVLAGATGLPMSLIGSLISGVAGTNKKPNPKLIELLSIQGVLTNLPQLIRLLTQISGVQTHGEYHLPKPEFGGRTGIQVGCDIMAAFRR
ncbi:hypothetical protein [Mycobacterium phage Maco2]|uniref:Peptidoglycan binding-like domain-containing protein n=2 Tax=Mapvirus Ff47 TaxID=1920751 RepID=A0A899IMD4_9CAUD|nr:hypothetical protein [Mycobacterium phage Maco2]